MDNTLIVVAWIILGMLGTHGVTSNLDRKSAFYSAVILLALLSGSYSLTPPIGASVSAIIFLSFFHQLTAGKPGLVFGLSWLLALGGPWSLPFFLAAFLILLVKRAFSRLKLLLPGTIPAIWFLKDAFDSLVVFEVTRGGLSLWDYVRLVPQDGGIWALMTSAMTIGFVIIGLGFSYHRWQYGKDELLAPLVMWIVAILFSWFMFSYPVAAANREVVNLYGIDVFLFMLAFPGAVAGGLMLNEARERIGPMFPAAILGVILVSGGLSMAGTVGKGGPSHMDRDAIEVLRLGVDPGDLVLSSSPWLADQIGCEVRDVYYPRGKWKNVWGLLSAEGKIWERFGITGARFLGAVMDQHGDRGPRYILISREDMVVRSHLIDFFGGVQNRFEVVYWGDSAMIVRIAYFDRDYATYEPIGQIPGKDVRDISPMGVVASVDADPSAIGGESWLSKFIVDGEEMYFAVSKETGEIREVVPPGDRG